MDHCFLHKKAHLFIFITNNAKTKECKYTQQAYLFEYITLKMNNYDFSTLNDNEFEQLVLELLNARYNLKLQGFKSGKDKGIDLRFSTPSNNNEIIVQVKRFIKSSFSQLKQVLKEEYKKVERLAPSRYIVVTSLPLSKGAG